MEEQKATEKEIMTVLEERYQHLLKRKPNPEFIAEKQRHPAWKSWHGRCKEVKQCKAWINHFFRHKRGERNEIKK